MFMFMDQFDSAQVIIDQLTREDTHHVLREGGTWQQIKLFILTGQYRKALDQFEYLREIYTERADMNTMAMTYIVEQHIFLTGWADTSATRESINEILEHRDGITRADFWSNLALIHGLMGDEEAAKEIIGEMRDEPAIDLAINLLWLFRFCFNQECARAESLIADTDIMSPESEPTIRYIMGLCYLDTGEPEKTLEQTRALGVHSTFDLGRAFGYPRRHYLSGRAYEQLGDPVLAAEHYRTFIEIFKDGDQDILELMDAKERIGKLAWN
jgi:tetratricopeptide (TPR) repeat protein